MITDYSKAKKDFLSAKFQGCKHFFQTHNYKLEQAYCEMILDNLQEAYELFKSLENIDLRANWGMVMLEFIKGCVSHYPTYFELRNFLEIDLNILITYCKGDYVEKIVRYADFMFTINPEVYKFIGRVFLNNDLKPQALFFLNRARDNFYQDPELHYIFAQIFKEENNIAQCRKALLTCLEILPGYAPAEILLKEISGCSAG